uniref:Putative tail protein n=1 Tax=viral metagenome TaxID=1070528 RepID=A0A6M3XGR8_9ZZZZ
MKKYIVSILLVLLFVYTTIAALSETAYDPTAIHDSVTTADIATSAVTTVEILDGTIIAADIATSAVTTIEILDGTILAGDIATSAVTTTEILNGTIIAEDLASNSVTTVKIADSNVTTAKITDETIVSADIYNGTIVAVDIATGAVTTIEILDGTILAADIATGAITTVKIADINDTNIANWNTSYDHSQTTTGNPHDINYVRIGLSLEQVIDWTAATQDFNTTGTLKAGAITGTGINLSGLTIASGGVQTVDVNSTGTVKSTGYKTGEYTGVADSNFLDKNGRNIVIKAGIITSIGG